MMRMPWSDTTCAMTDQKSFKARQTTGIRRPERVPVVAGIIGCWPILFWDGIQKDSLWIYGQGCVIIKDHSLLRAVYIYVMLFDFLVLCLTAYKLAPPGSFFRHSRLANLIFRDGLIYFVIALIINSIATAFVKLDLNPVMSIIGSMLVPILSTIGPAALNGSDGHGRNPP